MFFSALLCALETSQTARDERMTVHFNTGKCEISNRDIGIGSDAPS